MKIKLYKFVIFLMIVAVACLFVFKRDFVDRQYDKLCSLYYVYKGDKSYSKLKLHQAISNYERALRLYPGHYTAWFNLGNIYVVYEDYFSAIDAYQQAFTYNPKMITARMNYGIIASEKLGDFDGAIEQYKEVIKTKRHLVSIPFVYSNKKSYKTNKGIAYYNMGLAYRQKSLYVGDNEMLYREYLKQAIENYKQAAKILKKDYDTRYNLALAYQLYGDYNNAGLTYCEAIYLAPMSYDAHYNLAILLRHMKYYKESLAELEKATSLITDSEGMSVRQRYVFDIMNDVTKTIALNSDKEYMADVTEKPDKKQAVTYIGGKIVATEELDKEMLKSFKTCGSKSLFEDFD